MRRGQPLLAQARVAALEPLSRAQSAIAVGIDLCDGCLHRSILNRDADAIEAGRASPGSLEVDRGVEVLIWERIRPSFARPIMVAAFAGWNDAASAATTALEAMAVSLDAEPIAEIDPEEFYDFQVTRPTIRMAEGQTREVDWPAQHDLRRRGPERRARPGAGLRDRAEPALADLRASGGRGRRAARRRDGGDAGRAARRRRPHPAGADHRPRLRPRAGRARSASAARATRARPGSSASSTTPAGGAASLGEPLGGRPALRRRGPEPEGGAGAAAPPRGLHRRRDRGLRARGRDERFETQVDRAVASNPEIEELVQPARGRAGRGRRVRGQDVPSGDTIARDFQRFLRQRSRRRAGAGGRRAWAPRRVTSARRRAHCPRSRRSTPLRRSRHGDLRPRGMVVRVAAARASGGTVDAEAGSTSSVVALDESRCACSATREVGPFKDRPAYASTRETSRLRLTSGSRGQGCRRCAVCRAAATARRRRAATRGRRRRPSRTRPATGCIAPTRFVRGPARSATSE